MRRDVAITKSPFGGLVSRTLHFLAVLVDSVFYAIPLTAAVLCSAVLTERCT